MKRNKREAPTKREQKELRLLAALSDDAIDLSDIPEIGSWKKASLGRFYRPIKQSVTLRLDADILAWFKSKHAKYQTAVNQALRSYMMGSKHRAE